MPVLPISDGNGHLLPHAGLVVRSHMLSPDNEEFRTFYEALALTMRLISDIGGEAIVSVPASLLSTLAYMPALPEIKEQVGQRVIAGQTVGEMLAIIISAAAVAPEHASVQKATFLMSERLEKMIYGEGRAVPASRTHILKQWTKWKSVAHFWAAVAVDSEGPGESYSSWHYPEKVEPLLRLLAIAGAVEQRATSIYARAAKKHHGPVLNPAELWRAPGDLRIPTADLSALEISESARRSLERYRAPKSF